MPREGESLVVARSIERSDYFDLDGAPPGATYEGIPISLTAVAGNLAIEVVTRLD